MQATATAPACNKTRTRQSMSSLPKAVIAATSLILSLSCVAKAVAASLESDVAALNEFKATADEFSTLAANWTGDPCADAWLGVTCDQRGRVSTLNLDGSFLCGTIAPHLGNLTALTTLHLSSPNLRGPIPPELGKLPNLENLWITNSNVTGPIPAELAHLHSLAYIDLSSNNLRGPIPPELGDLTALHVLDLSNNGLSGSIPPNLGYLPLLWLNLNGNSLTGPVPAELGNIYNLRRLLLRDNDLKGPIPPQLGELSALESLDLSGNHLDGGVPEAFGNLTFLRFLDLSMNQLGGHLPERLAELPLLAYVDVASNRLTGQIPRALGGSSAGSASTLRVANFSSNFLVGGLPQGLLPIAKTSMNCMGFDSSQSEEALGGQRDFRTCSRFNVGLHRHCREPMVVGMDGACVSPLQLQLLFTPEESLVKSSKQLYRAFSSNLDSVLRALATTARVEGGQIAPVDISSGAGSAVVFTFNVIPVDGKPALSPERSKEIIQAFNNPNGNAVTLPGFETRYVYLSGKQLVPSAWGMILAAMVTAVILAAVLYAFVLRWRTDGQLPGYSVVGPEED